MIWDYKIFSKMDKAQLLVIFLLMGISLLVIASTTSLENNLFLTPYVRSQIKWFFLGLGVYVFFSGLDYRFLKKISPFLYLIMLILLFGLFFTGPIQNVQRWYKIPILNFTFQPSEYAKLIVVIALSRYLSDASDQIKQQRGLFKASLIVLIPFIMILKQPDLGTALVLFPIALGLFYLADANKRLIRMLSGFAISGFVFIALMFMKILSHETMKPFVTIFLKDYQYERLNPHTYHQNASQMAIALGKITGSGFKQSEFTGGGWLPAAHTDSVFAAYAEEYGLLGTFILLTLFFILFQLGLKVTQLAKDPFGRFLSFGITVTLAMHVFVNIGMMSGFLPITGVPLVMVSYGGSSVLSTMSALGIMQSIYTRRYLFS
jgi:rod shape determining protein RodA